MLLLRLNNTGAHDLRLSLQNEDPLCILHHSKSKKTKLCTGQEVQKISADHVIANRIGLKSYCYNFVCIDSAYTIAIQIIEKGWRLSPFLPISLVPTTLMPTTLVPTTLVPTPLVPTTLVPTTLVPTTDLRRQKDFKF